MSEEFKKHLLDIAKAAVAAAAVSICSSILKWLGGIDLGSTTKIAMWLGSYITLKTFA